jgi:hypothetical protein
VGDDQLASRDPVTEGALRRRYLSCPVEASAASARTLTSRLPFSDTRTWATFCAMIGRDPKWVAAQIGHVNPKFTFSVYQLVATRRYIDEQAVWALMRFSDEPAERVSSRQITRLQRDEAQGSSGMEQGEFDRGIERLIGGAEDVDGGD